MKSESSAPQFNVSASLIRRLGEEIVPDVASALTELIKNAYDADADWVKIEISTKGIFNSEKLHFDNSSLGFASVEDNGTGMSWDDVQQGWMNFSFSDKKASKTKQTTEKKRSPTGGQGMGRLGTMRLGECVELFTATSKESEGVHVAFSWNEFSQETHLTDVPLFIEKISNRKSNGTSLVIFPLNDPDQWQGESSEKIIADLTNKVFRFINRKNFQVRLILNGTEFEIGKTNDANKPDRKVYYENVWQKMSPALIDEVIRFWGDNKMLRQGSSSEERARQVVFVIRSERERKIVGLSTAAVVNYKQLNSNNFYFYRSIVIPEYRQAGLAAKIIVETRDFLEAYNKTPEAIPCIGLLTFVENPNLQQFKREAIWPASKMAYIGMDKEGRHIRVYYFKGAVI